MKTRIASLFVLCACLSAWGQPSPVYEATTNQVAAGTVGAPFYVSPRGLAGSGIGSPTNGQTAAQVGVLIASTNNAIIQPNINSASNSVVSTSQAAINTASNSIVATGQTSVNTSSNSVVVTMQTAINTASNSINSSINTSSNSIVTNLPPRASYPAMTNTTTGIIGNVLMTTAHLDTNGSPAASWTNLQPFNLEYHVLTNAFTNVVVGEIGPLTNKDGFIFWIPIGTNQ